MSLPISTMKAVNSIFAELSQPIFSFIWKNVYCPKNDNVVSWETCLDCSDIEKHPTCPISALREYMKPWPRYTRNVYHVTELRAPRQAFFNRTIEHVMDFQTNQGFLDMYVGTAVHSALQQSYPKRMREYRVGLPVQLKNAGFAITGRIDVLDHVNGLLIDFKVYLSLKWVLGRNAPEDSHIWQIQSYYEMLKQTEPEAAAKVKQILILYISKTKYSERWKEFYLDPVGNPQLVPNGEILHEAMATETPPTKLCPGVKVPRRNKFPCSYCAGYLECSKDWKQNLGGNK